MNKTHCCIIIAGGRTGGHLFPGIAVAAAVLKKNPGADILFVGTGESFELSVLKQYRFRHEKILSSGFKGKNLKDKLSSLITMPVSLFQAAKIIRRTNPGLVLGVGGFASGPVVLAAKLMGIKTAVQEQNAFPGLTNRILSYFTDVVFTSFPKTHGFKSGKKLVYTGNPVRTLPAWESEDFCVPPGCFTLLVTGGSQGASSINHAVTGAFTKIRDLDSFFIIHQTGDKDETAVRTFYEKMGVHACVSRFFHNMPSLQTKADLIVCRAGAGTISEITARSKPAVLVPYPHAADDHQTYNAAALADAGAAIMISDRDLSSESMAEIIEYFKNNPEKRRTMAEKAGQLSTPKADETIAAIIMAMAEKGKA
ncbi:MAG: undecaprenyldiphospho-muramoylpentapeptide beta-N-acetylglucosaminyltransferase [Desulfobacteraceae bacterium]